jgi:hypothetical protein
LFVCAVIGDSGSWAEVERLCLKLADLAATAQRSEKTPEDVKLEAARLFEAIDGNLPRPASFETEQVPALLMELRNVRAAPVTFLPPPRYGSRRELVEKFADEKKVTVPVRSKRKVPPKISLKDFWKDCTSNVCCQWFCGCAGNGESSSAHRSVDV